MRITLGSASPGKSASFTQRAPFGAGVARGYCGRAALTERRDLLTTLLAEHLPAWRSRPPDAGLSLWVAAQLFGAEGVLYGETGGWRAMIRRFAKR